MVPGLVLSVFPGIDLFGIAFEAEGYCLVRGPDLIWGGKIESFYPSPDAFEGIIGGSPCQDFSCARRAPPSGVGERLLDEFARVVNVAKPLWFILENVPGVPDVSPKGFLMQRFNLSASECGGRQRRLRRFQFGSRDRTSLVIDRDVTPSTGLDQCAMASEASRSRRRSFADFCELQGLPRTFDIPGISLGGKYRAVGNGVPIPMGRVIAAAIRLRTVTAAQRMCVCACGRTVAGRQIHATAACRKRMERSRRDSAVVTQPGPDTPGRSLIDLEM